MKFARFPDMESDALNLARSSVASSFLRIISDSNSIVEVASASGQTTEQQSQPGPIVSARLAAASEEMNKS